MNKKTLLAAALCGALSIVLAAPASFSQVSTSPGKKVAFETVKGVTLYVYPHRVLTAAIVKGKPKHVITVDGMVRLDLPPGVATLSLGADVNGLEMHPTGTMGTFESALQECPTVGMGCTATATLIMDLDAAELASPGHFINQPLTITLWAGDAGPGGGDGEPVDVSMIVRMEKKR
jgi:hypothetical protein